MGTLIALVVLLVLFGVIAFGVAGIYAAISGGRDENRRAALEADRDQALDGLFDGAPQVVYVAPNSSGGLSTATLVQHAGQHGYRMVSETGQMATRTVVFEKAASQRGT